MITKRQLQERLARERRLTLLINVRSRRGAAMHQQARASLESRGWTVGAEHLVDDPAGQLPDLLPRIAAEAPASSASAQYRSKSAFTAAPGAASPRARGTACGMVISCLP